MRKEIDAFLGAVMFYTRFPVPKGTKHARLEHSSKYLPLIGIFIGALAAATFYAFQLFLSQGLSLLLAMVTSFFVTGAFHEDGLADFCDGFGGGWTKERILQIMKDSRIGTYGALGLLSVLSIKYVALNQSRTFEMMKMMICGHAVSRFFAVSFMHSHEYVERDDSKSRLVATRMTTGDLMVALLFGVASLLIFWDLRILFILPVMVLARTILSRMFLRRIGGYTGDCLGAAQQISEVLFYIAAYAALTII